MKQELYRKLQARVYEILYPEGIPLEFGVEFLDDDGFIDTLITISNNKISAVDNEGNEISILRDKHIIKTLGKPLSLQDLLILLDKINPYPKTRDEIAHSYKISMEGTLYENSYKWNGDVSGYYGITSIDLLKPISKQDNEVLETLLEIIN